MLIYVLEVPDRYGLRSDVSGCCDARAMDIERRLDLIESRIAILELTARYCHGADGRDADAFLSVWHSDAVWDVSSRCFKGHEEIGKAVAHQWRSFEAMHHSTSNSVIEIASDSDATGHHDVLALTTLLDGRSLLSSGHYIDRYTRSCGTWAIAERRATVTATVEVTALAGLPTDSR